MVVEQTARGMKFEADVVKRLQEHFDNASFVPGTEYTDASNVMRDRQAPLTPYELARLIRYVKVEGYGVRYVGGTE